MAALVRAGRSPESLAREFDPAANTIRQWSGLLPARRAPDLVNRDFTATAPHQLWVADITYIPTWAGLLYGGIVLNVWSRRVVGGALATHLRTELVLEALDMALVQRRPKDSIHHSDPLNSASTRHWPSGAGAG